MYNNAQLKEIIDKALVSISSNSDFGKLLEPVKYALSVRGKRLRPILTLMACNLFTDNINDAVAPAAGLEIFHNFTLIHDDIMDNALVRRNFPSVHAKWGLNQAILSGDVMAFLSNECFLQLPPEKIQKVFRIFNTTAIEVCQGQQLDMDYEKREMVVEEDYIRMIQLKTAVLIAASLKIGAVIGGADDKEAQMLYEYGLNIGLAFQIQDDILDIWSEEKVFGKVHGGDIVANKKTLPIIKAFEIASGDSLRKLREYYSPGYQGGNEQKIIDVIDILDRLEIKEKTMLIADSYIATAFKLLKSSSVEENRKEEITSLTNNLVCRNR